MILKKSFIIKEKEGHNFSLISGDKNKIHINKNYAYNSIFGEKICFGVQILIKIIKLANLSITKYQYLKILYNQPALYNKKILIKIKRNREKIEFIKIYQLNKYIGEIIFKKNDKNFQKDSYFKKIKKKFSFKELKNKTNPQYTLSQLLMRISNYVGNHYPGEHSLLTEIEIFYYKHFKFKKFDLRSQKYDKRFNLINNYLEFKNFRINFKSLERPKIKNSSKIKYSKKIISFAKNFKDNILIIGASQGIGYQFFNIFKLNNKIKIFASYHRNKIEIKKQNIKPININILSDLKKVFSIVKKFQPIKIFYFPSEKIYFGKKLDNKILKSYKKIFIEQFFKIVNKFKNNNKVSFFYPSTVFIENSNESTYSKIKLKAEKEIIKINKKNTNKIMFHRFPAIYSRQSINLLDLKPIHLHNYLDKNSNLLKLIVKN